MAFGVVDRSGHTLFAMMKVQNRRSVDRVSDIVNKPQSPPRRTVPVIGVTGPIGAGKSAVAEMFGRWGGVVITADAIGHEILSHSATVRARLARTFGCGILRGRSVDRARLAHKAFVNPQTIALLNSIVHPPLVRELKSRIRMARSDTRVTAIIVDAALLVEWSRRDVFWDCLVGVWAPRRLRLARLRKRGLTDRDIRARERGQASWTERRRRCDCVIRNDGSRATLERQARLCWQKLLSLSA